jgi:hypothetical protein
VSEHRVTPITQAKNLECTLVRLSGGFRRYIEANDLNEIKLLEVAGAEAPFLFGTMSLAGMGLCLEVALRALGYNKCVVILPQEV